MWEWAEFKCFGVVTSTNQTLRFHHNNIIVDLTQSKVPSHHLHSVVMVIKLTNHSVVMVIKLTNHYHIIMLQGVELLTRSCPTPLADQSSASVESSTTTSAWSSLRTLNLSYNKLGVACGRGLAALLGHCKGLQTLSLTSCRLAPSTFAKDTGLCEALKGNWRSINMGSLNREENKSAFSSS